MFLYYNPDNGKFDFVNSVDEDKCKLSVEIPENNFFVTIVEEIDLTEVKLGNELMNEMDKYFSSFDVTPEQEVKTFNLNNYFVKSTKYSFESLSQFTLYEFSLI